MPYCRRQLQNINLVRTLYTNRRPGARLPKLLYQAPSWHASLYFDSAWALAPQEGQVVQSGSRARPQ